MLVSPWVKYDERDRMGRHAEHRAQKTKQI